MVLYIVLILIIIFLSYIIVNLYRKYNKLYNTARFFAAWVDQFKINVEFINTKMSDIDRSGHFSSDDEIGFAFVEIKNLMKLLYELDKSIIQQ